jgi:hypothetical protein
VVKNASLFSLIKIYLLKSSSKPISPRASLTYFAVIFNFF